MCIRDRSLPYPAQQVIENEVVMARSQYHIVKQIRHGNKITDSQYLSLIHILVAPPVKERIKRMRVCFLQTLH